MEGGFLSCFVAIKQKSSREKKSDVFFLSKKLHSSETSKNSILGRAKNQRLRKPPPSNSPICLEGGFLSRSFFVVFFLVRKLPPEARNFSGFDVRFDRKPLEMTFPMLKSQKKTSEK